MDRTNHRTSLIGLALCALPLGGPAAFGQHAAAPPPPAPHPRPTAPSERAIDDDAPEWMKKLSIDPAGETARKYREQATKRKAVERDLRKIRGTYFLTRNVKRRQEGINKLWEYKDPAVFPAMMRIYEWDEADIRQALLDIFADSRSDGGDAALTWIAIFDRDESLRKSALARLRTRLREAKETPLPIKLAVYEGLASGKAEAMSSAAGVAQGLQLVEAIPWLINAQIQQQPLVQTASTGTSNNSALAWIAVGQQTAYVSGLRPVVAANAVAFDPQVSVITTGTLLRVLDAVAFQYNFDVHNALVDISSNAWGEPTRSLGFNVPKWNKWYAETFSPFWAKKQAALAAKAAQEQKPGEPGGPTDQPPAPGGG